MRNGRPKAVLGVAEAEHQALTRWARRPKSSQQLALRSRIILACGRGLNSTQVAAELRITQQTVGKWRQRFIDDPRPFVWTADADRILGKVARLCKRINDSGH